MLPPHPKTKVEFYFIFDMKINYSWINLHFGKAITRHIAKEDISRQNLNLFEGHSRETCASSQVTDQVITNAHLNNSWFLYIHTYQTPICSAFASDFTGDREEQLTWLMQYHCYEFNNTLTLAFNIIGGDAVPFPLHHWGPVSVQMSRAQALSHALAPSAVQRARLSQPEDTARVHVCKLSLEYEEQKHRVTIGLQFFCLSNNHKHSWMTIADIYVRKTSDSRLLTQA